MRYRMVAIDLDGTLLDPTGRTHADDLAAMATARRAGAMIVPCTGRSWRESKRPLDGVDLFDEGVFLSGATVHDVADGRTLHRRGMAAPLVLRLVEHLHDQPEVTVVACDAEAVGHDYLVTGSGEIGWRIQRWFDATGVAVRRQQSVSPQDVEHALRVSLVAPPDRMRELIAIVEAAAGDAVALEHVRATRTSGVDEAYDLLGITEPGVDKWTGLQWIAQRRGVAPEQIAMIGDEMNDLTAFEGAGCAIAMGNAVDILKGRADHVTRPNTEAGVAHAIEQLLAGAWG